jgi:hypothetical protein
MMEKLIGCCGLNCATCDARIATVANNDELRIKTAERMRAHYNLLNVSIEMINCTGCREAGATMWYCEKCDIRNCVSSKKFQTCAECESMESCLMVLKIHQYEPVALENLKSLK